jgi:hypothetical protein
MSDVQSEVAAEGIKHGRRRHAEANDEGGGAAPPPKQRAGAAAAGWGDEAAGGGSGSAAAAPAPAEEPAVTVVRENDEAAEAAERLAATVADAPRHTGRRVATLKELEGEGSAGGAGSLNVAASRAEGIDLSLLTASLHPVEALHEADEVINWELQLQKITQEMRQESDQREGEEGGEGGAGSAAAEGGSPARPRA